MVLFTDWAFINEQQLMFPSEQKLYNFFIWLEYPFLQMTGLGELYFFVKLNVFKFHSFKIFW